MRGLSGHHLRASADMGIHANPPTSARSIRPASEVYYNSQNHHHGQGGQDEAVDKDAQQWISEIDSAQNTLEEMAAATLDQDFKDELSAIEQWFRVLSEAERTAALYALLQQTTGVQTRFFIGILQQMAKTHPLSGMLSPSGFGDKDPMSNRLSTAMNRLSVEGSRNSMGLGRPPPSPGAAKRNSGLDQSEINSMFPEAAAAIAKQKADFTQRTGTEPRSNRSSAIVGDRTSMAAPSISAPQEERGRDIMAQPAPWGTRNASDNQNRPKSSSGQQPMGQFSQPAPSAGLRSSRPTPLTAEASAQHANMNAADLNSAGLPLFSPYTGSGNWASMVNTPMVSNFSNQDSANQANMVASATASKLQAMGTVNSRVMLDDARKYRRSRSTEGQRGSQPMSAGLHQTGIPSSLLMTNEHGQILSPQQAATLQAQQLAVMQNGMSRSRPASPGLLSPGQGLSGMNLSGTTNNGFLSAYDTNQALINGMGGMNIGHHGGGFGSQDYDNDRHRGRSPRGKRGTSRAPEDPTDLELLKDIPAWLRSLRLHKYTDNLKDIPWQQLIEMNDDDLDKRGVNALGARRKMLKVFEEVKDAMSKGKFQA
ncbi:MAG: Flap-structured DNA-binding and RNA-binding protein [Chrysothrix sp. TS-e1954]|nr:MAG: Flap-structured DNA-binding and RNA-binding protein [Chrysothrix sp. TS-e1954]